MEDMSSSVLRFWTSSRNSTSVCRLCFREDSECSSLKRPLYVRTDGFRGTLTIKQLLAQVLQTTTYENESYPSDICDICLETALRFFTFWQHCKHTEAKLVTQLKRLSKQVSIIHSDLLKKNKSKYSNKSLAILRLGSKNIDYINCYSDSKLIEVQKYLNGNVPKTLIKKSPVKVEIIKTIRENITPNIKSHTESNLKYNCDYCPENFKIKDQWLDHLKSYHNILDIAECTECGKKFKTIQLLKQHSITHKGPGSKCSICKKHFDSSTEHETHINETHTEFKYKCPDCQELFRRKRDLKIHQWNTHRIGYEYYCKMCGKKFKNYHAVRTHEESHEDYNCEKCAEKFNTKIKLERHLMICSKNKYKISDFKTFTCDYCQKSFLRKPHLREHITNLHLYPKRHKCTQCDKRFATKTHALTHMVVHTRKRTEQCHICYHYFVSKYALTYHMRLHTGERPYACELCDEKFLSSSRRTAHVKKMHIGAKEECNVCFKSYYTGFALKRHMQRHCDPNSTLFENNLELK